MKTDHPASHDGTIPASQAHSTLFYRRRGVVVTTGHLLADGGYYEVAGLTDVTETRGPVHAGVVVGVVTALVEAVVLLPFIGTLSTPMSTLMVAVVLLVPCVVAVLCARLQRPRLELRARYRGCRVVLFATTDRLEYNQVSRALHRAMEAAHRNRQH